LIRPAGAAAVQRSQRAKERHTQIISTDNETANLLLETTKKNSGKKKMKKNVGARRSEKRAPGDTFTRQYIHIYVHETQCRGCLSERRIINGSKDNANSSCGRRRRRTPATTTTTTRIMSKKQEAKEKSTWRRHTLH
jgi:hypothetical protein